MPPRPRREASAERLRALLTKTFAENPAITSANDLRDFAKEAEEGEEVGRGGNDVQLFKKSAK